MLRACSHTSQAKPCHSERYLWDPRWEKLPAALLDMQVLTCGVSRLLAEFQQNNGFICVTVTNVAFRMVTEQKNQCFSSKLSLEHSVSSYPEICVQVPGLLSGVLEDKPQSFQQSS